MIEKDISNNFYNFLRILYIFNNSKWDISMIIGDAFATIYLYMTCD